MVNHESQDDPILLSRAYSEGGIATEDSLFHQSRVTSHLLRNSGAFLLLSRMK